MTKSGPAVRRPFFPPMRRQARLLGHVVASSHDVKRRRTRASASRSFLERSSRSWRRFFCSSGSLHFVGDACRDNRTAQRVGSMRTGLIERIERWHKKSRNSLGFWSRLLSASKNARYSGPSVFSKSFTFRVKAQLSVHLSHAQPG